MKIRFGFVSNSSSTSFLITNISDSPKNFLDFLVEHIGAVHDINGDESGYYNLTIQGIIDSVHRKFPKDLILKPNESREIEFESDVDDDVDVFVHKLMDWGSIRMKKSKSFEFHYRGRLS